MAYTVDWDTRIISVPQSDLVDLGGGVYKLDLELCHQELRRLEWEFSEGLSREQILEYTPPKLAGGVIYAAFVILINGYWMEFEDGQYAINFDGANTNIQDYTVINQVSIRPNNSAGLQDLSTILASAYSNRVVVNPTNGQSGTATPIGTLGTPSNNIPEAVTIADNNGIGEIYLAESMSLVSGDDVSGLSVSGASPIRTSLIIEDGANVYQSTFKNCTINGILDGRAIISESIVDGLDYVTGFINNSGFTELPVVLGAASQATILNCFSNVSGSATPTIDMNGAGQSLAMRNYSGGIRIKNRTSNDPISIDMVSGHVIVDATCTGDPITIRGTFKLTVEPGATTPDILGRGAMSTDITAATGDVNIVSVQGVAVVDIDDFKADVTALSADVNVVEVAGITVTSISEFKNTATDTHNALDTYANKYTYMNAELDIHAWLDSYANKAAWDNGISENNLHSFLNTYANKIDWQANEASFHMYFDSYTNKDLWMDSLSEADLHIFLDSYINKSEWQGEVTEAEMHSALDSYLNKNLYQADLTGTNAKIDSVQATSTATYNKVSNPDTTIIATAVADEVETRTIKSNLIKVNNIPVASPDDLKVDPEAVADATLNRVIS